MNVRPQILDPSSDPGWDDSLASFEDATFFHSSAWARVLSSTYGFRPLYLALTEDGRATARLPVMEVSSRLTGRRGVSLPFSDYCEPLCRKPEQADLLLAQALEAGKTRGWRSYELRGGRFGRPERVPACRFYRYEISLASGEEGAVSGFRSSVRRNIRKAERAGVQVRLSGSWEDLLRFCRLNDLTRRRHGLPPQPRRFFRNFHQHVLTANRGVVVLAELNGQAVAAAVFVHFGGQAFFKYGASDPRHQDVRPNDLVMSEAIRWSARQGCRRLCLGRAEPENEGLRRFKMGWGASEREIAYYRYDFRKGAYVKGRPWVTGVHNAVFRKMPIPVLRAVGALLYRHVA